MRFCAGEGSVHLNLKILRSVIESHCHGLTGQAIDDPLEFDEALRFDDKRLTSLWRFVRFMSEEIEHDENLLSQPLIGERFAETVLTTILYVQPHCYSTSLNRQATPSGPHYVRRAEEYMETHCEEPITASLLATAVGVNVRTLYAAFRKHRDYTPFEFLRSVRLRRARSALLSAPPGSKVRDVALKWGFNHIGRFSSLYRRHFGESPSDTLRSRS
jgi:AraC-like DNA-binding protein